MFGLKIIIFVFIISQGVVKDLEPC